MNISVIVLVAALMLLMLCIVHLYFRVEQLKAITRMLTDSLKLSNDLFLKQERLHQLDIKGIRNVAIRHPNKLLAWLDSVHLKDSNLDVR
jgi:hypothetical protein